MAGVDWNLVYERYFPLLNKVATRSEFSDLIWEMQGELGTSHAYEMGGDYRQPPNYKLGSLAADYEFDKKENAYKITHIVKGDSWKNDSPLLGLGVDVKENDYIISNDLKSFNIKTLASDTPARYREWVEKNREYVHKKSDGKLGYLHIPDMMAPGFSEFHRYYIYEVSREGLIVDARYNRGGHVSQLLLEKLSRKRVGYDLSRYGATGSYPCHSVAGPIVALTNEYAGSDGDIFSHNFKQMNLGTLIGKRTWGGVIGINPRLSLADGTVTTQPEYATYMKDVGWNVENYGTDPDIEIDIAPQDYTKGKDPQLDKGIELALDELKKNPVEIPKFDDKPMLPLPVFEIKENRLN
jgi:tricorn protease